VSFWDTLNIENKVKNALKMASCFDFVQELSEKKIPLGNNGINVSGGQKQTDFYC
jgi:ABC-type multidrug transport system fused ATPase/permease subunit